MAILPRKIVPAYAHAEPAIVVPSQPRIRRRFNYAPLLLLLAAGVALRALLVITYFPAVMLSFDAPRYAGVYSTGFFGDFWLPAAYPALLKFLRLISTQLWFPIALQHLTGIGLAIVVYATAKYLGVRRSLSCVPAAVPLLSGDHLFLEHQIITEPMLMLLAVAGMAAGVRGLVPQVNARWLSLASALLGLAALTSSVGIVLLPILVLAAVWWARGPAPRRVAALAAALLPGAGVFLVYLGAFAWSHGQYLGLWDMSGWNLYARVAPFADCRRFEPPKGTEMLCETSAPADRPGPFGYLWVETSVPRQTFALGPETGRTLRGFAVQAILHQPGDYVKAVAWDLARYLDPYLNRLRPYGGQPNEVLSFGWRDASVEALVVGAMSQRYSGTAVHLRGQKILGVYQNVLRLNGLEIAVLAVLALIGLVKGSTSLKCGIFLFGAGALGLYMFPVLTLSYDFRYGIPPETLLAMAGVLGAASLSPRLREQHPPSER